MVRYNLFFLTYDHRSRPPIAWLKSSSPMISSSS